MQHVVATCRQLPTQLHLEGVPCVIVYCDPHVPATALVRVRLPDLPPDARPDRVDPAQVVAGTVPRVPARCAARTDLGTICAS